MKKVKLLAFLLMLFVAKQAVYSQVTTSSLSGQVTDGNETLVGAAVKATHEPSGTVYGAVTNNNGRFAIQGMRTGGPYHVEILYLGYADYDRVGIYLQLGETYVLNAQLTESTQALSEVTVSGQGSQFAGEKTGSMTNIRGSEMAMMPTINRSLSDYTKLSPYATGTGSFGGRPAYATNISIDGANFNNNFGLNENPMPGPSASSADPISADAIEEMQVAIAPYDVRQSNFTGAGVNVVTKSGTNKFQGSAYMYYRNQNMTGSRANDYAWISNESQRQVYGFTLGGPIIKNKLFFFVSGELENNLTPGNTLLAGDGDGGRDESLPNVNNNVTGAQLQEFSNFLNSKFGYKTGRYENWGGDNENSRKLLAKIDWNINQKHKATLRYNYSALGSVSRPSSSIDASPSLRSRHADNGGMSFENSQYRSMGYVNSVTGELNSRFTDVISNNFLVAYTNYYQPRETGSDIFPTVDIMDGNPDLGNVMMTAGYEPFSYKNIINNNTLIVTDNIMFSLGKHTVTGGISYENQYVRNSYWREGTGYYRYKDFEAFQNHVSGDYIDQPFNADYHPINFAYAYPINGNTYDDVPELTFGQFSAYGQDEWHLSEAFKLTYGLRIDLPMYLSGAIDNPVTREHPFRDGEIMDLGKWPTVNPLFSPRVGFNWDVTENKTVKLRGGVGIFTGRIPFVWFTNQPQNSGMLQYQKFYVNSSSPASQEWLAMLPFKTNVQELLSDPTFAEFFPQENQPGGNLAAAAKDFKLPQVLRSSVAADFRLPLNMQLTLEGMYTKDINAIIFDNINIVKSTGTLVEGGQSRPKGFEKANDTYGNAIVMRNTGKGYGYNLSAQLTLPSFHGLSGNIAYTYSYAEEVTGKNGSDPYSAWRYRHIKGSPNDDEVGLTLNNTPHRIIAGINYQTGENDYTRSTVSLFYNGYTGRAFSFIYATDANGDGTSNDLIYIPKNKDDLPWASDADYEAWVKFAAQDPYLSKHAGEYAERYAAYEPFYHRLDFRFMQDFYIKAGSRRHTLQLSMDIINLPNLLNSKWGVNKQYLGGSFAQVTPLGYNQDGKVYMYTTDRNDPASYMTTAYEDRTTTTVWQMQFGLRYIF
ncbi:MAG: carboxypeptidase regulatory-like domain-containing protein [Cytophagaceae bacterium]|nr:carboxypeptidase regulatory-like domain-containing protein [Cytophagaceae bacterium]